MSKWRGNCYVTSEAVYHLLGGKEHGWHSMCMRHEGDTHWFLQHNNGMILDLTVSQFKKKPNYTKARRRAFLTKLPSKRAQSLMDQMVWQLPFEALNGYTLSK